MRALGGSALFAAHFRENAARALLLPRRRPGQRTPLWMQRQRSSDLLTVASRYGLVPDHPRDVPRDPERRLRCAGAEGGAGRDPVARHPGRSGRDALGVAVRHRPAVRLRRHLPVRGRRARWPSGGPRPSRWTASCWPSCSARTSCASCSTPPPPPTWSWSCRPWPVGGASAPSTRSHDLLRRRRRPAHRRGRGPHRPARRRGWRCRGLERDRRIVPLRLGGEERWIAIEDVARYRDAFGASPPPGVAETWLQVDADGPPPLDALLLRWARTHAPFTPAAPAARWGIAPSRIGERLRALVESGTLLEGAFRPGGTEHEFADADVLRSLRRRSLARLRREVEPVPAAAFGRFLPAWHGIGSAATGHDRLLEVITQLEGYPLPASILERDVLPARVRDYAPRLLDELGAAGEVVWIGRGPLGRDDGRVALYRRDRAELLASAGAFEPGERPEGPLHDAIRQHLERRGASFFGALRLAISAVAQRRGAARRAVGPRLVGRGHQRHLRRSARADAAAHPLAHSATARPARGHGTAARCRPLVADRRPHRRGPLANRARPRHSAGAAGAARRGDARGGAGRGAGRWLRVGLRGAEGHGGGRPGATRLLRGGSRRGPVRDARRGRPPPCRARVRVDSGHRWSRCWPPPIPRSPMAPPCRGRATSAADRLPLQRVAGAYVVMVDGEAALYVERGGRGPAHPAGLCRQRGRGGGARGAAAPGWRPSGPMRELRLERVDRVPPAESAHRRAAARAWASGPAIGPGCSARRLRPETGHKETSRRNLASTL